MAKTLQEILNACFTGNALNVTASTGGFYTKRYDYDENGNVVYIGYAQAGASETDAVWIIKKIEYDNNGNPVAELYAEGSVTFNKKWSERNNYSYL